MPHYLATEIAVSTLSPVTIIDLIFDYCNYLITVCVIGFNLFSIMEELTDGLMDALMKGRGLKAECMEEDI